MDAILTNEKKQFQKEQDQLLQTLLDLRFFQPWKTLTKFNDDKSLQRDSNLELYLTNSCNQTCEYCYLQKYPELYPKEFNKPEIIIKNLHKICKWILVNNFKIPCIDIFTGDIWGSQFGWDVLDVLYSYMLRGMAPNIGHILIPSNCSFVNNPKALQRVQQYIDKFNDIGTPLIFSISIDGKIIDNEGRPDNYTPFKYTDDYYDVIATFAKVNDFYFHPMISPHNVHLWKENYKWWRDYLKKYDRNLRTLMLLEVRDADWTDEAIQDYCDLMRVIMDDMLHTICHDNKEAFAGAILNTHKLYQETFLGGYVPWIIGFCDTFAGCTVSTHLTIRVGDLAICPCHRTAYNQYLYGYLLEENGNLTTKVKAVNPQMAIKILMNNLLTGTPLCDKCIYNQVCLHGCYGSQLESEKDPFFPSANVCKFFKRKIASILKYYEEKGVIDFLKSIGPNDLDGAHIIMILQLYENAKEAPEWLGN